MYKMHSQRGTIKASKTRTSNYLLLFVTNSLTFRQKCAIIYAIEKTKEQLRCLKPYEGFKAMVFIIYK